LQDSKSLLNQLSKNIGGLAWIFSVSTLALSVFYDFSYLSALDLDFGEVQTSISDHVRSAIVWLPWGVVLIGFLALIIRMFQQLDGNQSIPMEFDNHPSKVDVSRMLNRSNLLTILTWAVFSFGAIFTLNSNSVNYIVFLLGWLVFSTSIGMRVPAKVYFSSPFRVALFFGPLIVSSVGMFGTLSAELALNENEPVWRVSFRQTEVDKSVTVNAVLLRKFSSTTIIATTDKKIILIPESEALSAEKISSTTLHTNAERLWIAAKKVVKLFSNSGKKQNSNTPTP
jgi:hypothetical protein